jgi:hypothetical protein
MRHRRCHFRWLLLAAATCIWWAAPGSVRAQDEPPAAVEVDPAPSDKPSDSADTPAAEPDAKPAKILPGEVQPQVFHVKDRDGKLRAVPGMSYEKFMELWKQQHQLAVENQQPAFAIESLDISGTTAGATAELVVTLTIEVHQAGWVGVPLRLNGAVLHEAPKYEGPGKQVMHVDPEGDGHVAWIHSEPDQKHVLVLKLMANVEQVGPQSRLRLAVPQATVSQLVLNIPLAKAEAAVSEGSKLDVVRSLDGGKTQIKVIGLTGDFELTWHPSDSKVAGLPTILEASSTQLVRINGRSANTDVKLTVRSLGSEFDHFQVRLPPGADYIGTPESGVSLVAVDASAPAGKLYDVRLEKRTTGPVEVRLVTERAHNATQDDGPLQLAGFEVLGAVRQWGTVAVQVEGNWQVVWGESNHVRSVDDVGASVRRDELAAGFEYFVQPYSLTARVVPQKTRIRVEPEYTLLVGGEEVRLLAKVKYIIRGAKVRSLAIDLPGWEVDAVGPASLVNVDTALASADESLNLPLLQATSGELELTFEARRRLTPGSDEIRLDLPQPRDDVMAANVAVVSDDPIELVPRLEEIEGLTPQSARPEMKLPPRQQEPQFYRTTGGPARYVAELKVHAQAISTAVSTQLRLGETDVRVEETLSFDVAYQPTDHFTLIVPAGIRPQRLTITHAGTRIVPVPVRESVTSGEAAIPVLVNLPAPTIGRCELQVSYAHPHDKPPTQASSLVTVPLVVPGEGQLTDNQVTVLADPGVSASYPQGPWSREGRSTEADDSGELLLSARRAIPEVILAVSSKQSPTETSTVVERAVLQTQLTDSFRQDRALFRLSTNRRRIDVSLPEGADMRSLAILVNGAAVLPESIRTQTATIPLDSGMTDLLLEVRYHFAGRAPQGSLEIQGPQLPSARWIQQLYWQLIVPSGEHVVLSPERYTEELGWVWSDFFWQRESTLGEQDLERWVSAGTAADESFRPGAASLARTSGGSANRYLFSTVGTVEPLRFYTLGRARLVLLASLPLLVFGLGLIYVPWLRHPATLFVMAILVAAAGLVAPQVALLLAQASLLGLVLLGVAALMARLVPRTAVPTPPARGSSYAVIERSVTELYHRSPGGGSHPASTATNPLVSMTPEGEP